MSDVRRDKGVGMMLIGYPKTVILRLCRRIRLRFFLTLRIGKGFGVTYSTALLILCFSGLANAICNDAFDHDSLESSRVEPVSDLAAALSVIAELESKVSPSFSAEWLEKLAVGAGNDEQLREWLIQARHYFDLLSTREIEFIITVLASERPLEGLLLARVSRAVEQKIAEHVEALLFGGEVDDQSSHVRLLPQERIDYRDLLERRVFPQNFTELGEFRYSNGTVFKGYSLAVELEDESKRYFAVGVTLTGPMVLPKMTLTTLIEAPNEPNFSDTLITSDISVAKPWRKLRASAGSPQRIHNWAFFNRIDLKRIDMYLFAYDRFGLEPVTLEKVETVNNGEEVLIIYRSQKFDEFAYELVIDPRNQIYLVRYVRRAGRGLPLRVITQMEFE